MKCPQCDKATEVLDKRGAVRTRLCASGHRFKTTETVTSGPRQKVAAPPPAPPGGLLAAVWHSPLPNSDASS